MRIAGGELRGRLVTVPKGARPTSGRVRAALFSRWHPSLPGCRFLDLFAGSGGVGIEALSRGARSSVLVESDRRTIGALLSNCGELAPTGCLVVRASALSLPDRIREMAPFDHVFADPPYAFSRYADLAETIAEMLAPEGEAAIEHSSRIELRSDFQGLEEVTSRRYGESVLSFLRVAG